MDLRPDPTIRKATARPRFLETSHLLSCKCSSIGTENNLQFGLYISSNSHSWVASDVTLLWAHPHTGKADAPPFLQGKGALQVHQMGRNKGQSLFPLKFAQGAFLSLTSRHSMDLRFHQRGSHFSQIPCFRGSEKTGFDLERIYIPQVVSLWFAKEVLIWQVYCWLEEKIVPRIFLTFVLCFKYTLSLCPQILVRADGMNVRADSQV